MLNWSASTPGSPSLHPTEIVPIIPIAQVKVRDRHREDYGDIADLAASLASDRFGQLAPIRIDQDNWLLAGGRRLAAAALLEATGRTVYGYQPGYIWAEYKDSLGLEHAESIELEENIRRKNLEMVEEQKAIARIHALKQKEDPKWDAEKTGELIGKSRRTVYNAIELTKAFDAHPDVAKAETASGAMKRLERIKTLAKREDEVKVAALAVGLGTAERKVQATVVHADAVDYMKGLDYESVDAVIFNPPFGVDIENLFTSGRKIYENDGAIEMTWLTEQVVEQAYRILKPDRWMVMFYPTARLEDVKGVGEPMAASVRKAVEVCFNEHFHETSQALNGLRDKILAALEDDVLLGMLRRHGFSFQQVPCQWIKPNKRVSALGDPYAQLNINYESFYFCRKGKAVFRKIPPADTFIVNTPPTEDRFHPLEMPPDLWQTILEAICVSGESIVEPFAGSGSGGEAAIRVGCNYVGIELDSTFALHANTRLLGAALKNLKHATPVEPPSEDAPRIHIDMSGMDTKLFGD